ncbi:isochorismatase family protein [Acidithiobacillus ferrivorans]|uniref:isochorismatase family protein n=1 Tax=Acidithiobacillus ferrivorans TaxID=160808 RepID=UPI001C0702A7|nr:isochorismatase family protein [Acidithiobacillus ferrivorans]MBU2849946.1 isochorismatase family protein [Acidithiobacillus ferrivorans]
MSIPQIEDYLLQAPDLSATNIVNWEQEDGRSILLVHDMQKYFLNLFPPALRKKLIDNCQKLVSHARKYDIPVVYTAQCGDMTKKERGLLFDIWGKGMSSRTEHTAITGEIAPMAGDEVLPKWRYSAFHATSLDEIFRKKNRDQIIICGVFAHVGVLASAVDAYSRDIEVFLVQDGIADFSKQTHLQALNYAAECCAKVLPSREVCK